MPNRLRQLEADGVISYYRNINQKTESKCKVSLQLFKHYKRQALLLYNFIILQQNILEII